jgi:hypothetical protein
MTINLRADINGTTGAVQIGNTDIIAVTSAGSAAATGKTLEATSGPSGSAFGFRNKIIGGDFTTNPWQRGTSFSNINGYGPDRWEVGYATTAGRVTISKYNDYPPNEVADYCMRIQCTTADAVVDAADLTRIATKIEGYNAASLGFGKSGTRYVTVSFWINSNKTGTYNLQLMNGGTNRSYPATYTINVANTWEKKTVTIQVDTTATGWEYGSGIGLFVIFTLMAGTNFQGTANAWSGGQYYGSAGSVNFMDNVANDMRIALVQLEAGSVATPFEQRPYGLELALCQRYYQTVVAGFTANVTSGVGYGTSTTFPARMRAVPQMSLLTSLVATSFPSTVGSFTYILNEGVHYDKTANATAGGRFIDTLAASAEL